MFKTTTMATIFDYLDFNNVSYYKLNEGDEKEMLKSFVVKLKEAGLEETILSLNISYRFNPRNFWHNGKDFYSNFPQDLTDKMIVIWKHLTEPKYHPPK